MNHVLTKPASDTVIGHFDGTENGLAVGWAFDSAKPGQRLQVQILCGDEVVAFGVAHQFREDLVRAGIGDGKHLFRLKISYELMDGRIHELTAREAGTGVPLHGGVIPFGPQTRKNDFDLISRAQGLALLQEMLRQPQHRAHASKAPAFSRLYRIGALAQETDRPDDARQVWEALQQALGDNALCNCKMGEIHLQENSPRAALDAYRAAVKASFGMPLAHLGMAQAYELLGQFAEAEEALELAAGLQPGNAAVQARLEKIRLLTLSQRVDTLFAEGMHQQAVQLLKQALIADPDSTVALNKLGDILTADTAYDSHLPGSTQLNRLHRAQRLLDFFLQEDEQNDATRGEGQ